MPLLIGGNHRVDVLGTGPVLDCFFHGGTLPGGTLPGASGTAVRLGPEHDGHGGFDLADLPGTPLAASPPTLTVLRAAALDGTPVCLREGTAW
ncbi:hypothetical protein [Streptomyces sp. NPDC086766]|uniref:hypothetical protein n=1 Tax=Streptomyces sp. NPDC086766 TaxID=3365754 RepID=UPI0037F8FB21